MYYSDERRAKITKEKEDIKKRLADLGFANISAAVKKHSEILDFRKQFKSKTSIVEKTVKASIPDDPEEFMEWFSGAVPTDVLNIVLLPIFGFVAMNLLRS